MIEEESAIEQKMATSESLSLPTSISFESNPVHARQDKDKALQALLLKIGFMKKKNASLEEKKALLDDIKRHNLPSPPDHTKKPFIGWSNDIPLTLHGWYLAHQAIRADLRDMKKIVDNLLKASQSNKFQSWMAASLIKFGELCLDFIELHHHNEDEIYFPFMKKRLPVPTTFYLEHLIIDDYQRLIREEFNTIKNMGERSEFSSVTNSLMTLEKLYKELADYLQPHLEEEETIWLPLLVQEFTKAEIKVPENEMLKTFDWYEMPHFYRTWSPKDRKTHMVNILEIPSFIIPIVFQSKFDRYDLEYRRLIDELMDFNLHPIHVAQDATRGCVIA